MSPENLAAVAGELDIIEKNKDKTEPPGGLPARLKEILKYADENSGGGCSVNELYEKFLPPIIRILFHFLKGVSE